MFITSNFYYACSCQQESPSFWGCKGRQSSQPILYHCNILHTLAESSVDCPNIRQLPCWNREAKRWNPRLEHGDSSLAYVEEESFHKSMCHFDQGIHWSLLSWRTSYNKACRTAMDSSMWWYPFGDSAVTLIGKRAQPPLIFHTSSSCNLLNGRSV